MVCMILAGAFGMDYGMAQNSDYAPSGLDAS